MPKERGLEYEVLGSGEPVLFIHGSLVAGTFLPLIHDEHLAEGYRLIRYHRRGCAGSDPAPAQFTIEDQARDAAAVLSHLGVDRAHVVGHSYGGLIALQLALAEPETVHSLSLLEPPLLPEATGSAFQEAMEPILDTYHRGDPKAAVDSFLCMACGTDWRTEAEATVPGASEQAENAAQTFFEVEVPAFMQWALDIERTKDTVQPVLYITGDQTAPIFRPGKELFRSLAPHCEHVDLARLNHLLQIRDPGLVGATIADFLARHPLTIGRNP